jgi:hypothetical protein
MEDRMFEWVLFLEAVLILSEGFFLSHGFCFLAGVGGHDKGPTLHPCSYE